MNIKKLFSFLDTGNVRVTHRNNFDIIRLCLASMVMLGHIPGNLVYLQPSHYIYFFTGEFFVNCFFCISGFLITKSFLSNPDLHDFFKKRILRIYPPIIIVFIIMAARAAYFHIGAPFIVSISNLLLFQDLQASAGASGVYAHDAFWTLVVFVAVFAPYLRKICFFGDISYSIYLYHFPVIVIFTSLQKNGKFTSLTTEQAAATMISATILLALSSYHLVEKRCINLGRKKKEQL